MNLKEKTVLITGSSQGLGLAISRKIAKEKAKVLLLARNENLLIKSKSDITKNGGIADYFVCDIY